MMRNMLFLLAAVFCSFIGLVKSCPSECRCDNSRKIVYCNERELTQFPYDIPLDTNILLLQGNHLRNSPSLEAILSKLQQLRRLDMHDNKLTSFPKNLPSSLQYLSLRKNSLKFISKDAFKTLHNLADLHLDINNLTDASISSGAFAAATSLRHLTLANNRLNSMPAGLSQTLQSLILAHNNISFVSPLALISLRQLLLLDLSFNKISDQKLSFDYLEGLKTLKLNNNELLDVPVFLPENLTDLRLSSNKIQYIYAKSSKDHGSFKDLIQLQALDLSSNLLLSVEENAFSSLPKSVSVEIQNNQWRCDCNLKYLKTWLAFASILINSKSTIICSSPDRLEDVTLEAIDVDSLTCSSSYLQPEIAETEDSSSVLVQYDSNGNGEPPYVTYSIIYGEMLCNDCSLQGSLTSSNHMQARLWMKDDYTAIPIPAIGTPYEIKHLASNTRYVTCIMASYQAPDQVMINQCRDFRTTSQKSVVNPPEPFTTDVPTWVVVLAVALLCLLLTIIVVIAVRSFIHSKRRNRSYIPGSRQRHIPGTTNSRQGLSYIDANREFDVTLVVRSDLEHKSGSYHSDSRDESFATSHTNTTTSLNSGLDTGRQTTSHHYEKPLEYIHSVDNNNYDRLRLNNRSPQDV